MIAGARVEVAPYKRDPMDFVLWKPSERRSARLGQPVGPGAARLAYRVLGHGQALLGDSFDIHGGGIDLMFPHHENEIAQSLRHHPARRAADAGRAVLHARERSRIAEALDALGLDYIEGGWPGANPTDSAFFDAAPKTRATMTAFGMTKRAGRSADNDEVLAAC
jgi:hypothetical protein